MCSNKTGTREELNNYLGDYVTDHHHEEPFWRKYIFSVDHKVIGIQYTVTALAFLLLGFCLMLIMRWNLANPGEIVPIVGKLLS